MSFPRTAEQQSADSRLRANMTIPGGPVLPTSLRDYYAVPRLTELAGCPGTAIPFGGETLTASCLKIFGIVFLARLPCGDRAGRRGGQWNKESLGRNARRAMVPLVVAAALTAVSVQTRSQSLSSSGDSSANAGVIFAEKPDYLTYVRPTPTAMLKHYAFDAFGPYALAFTAFTAGFDQATNTPPEWKQGFGGYAERFGSDFGIAAVGTTARYGTAAAFRDDTSYYRCECKGAFPRLGHAVFSTLTARRGRDGHRVFSFPALVAPYVGSMVGVYGWYPSRYGVKDALRMGNYSLLESAGTNIALEFLYKGPHFLFSRMHLNHFPGAPDPGSKQ